MTNSSEQFEASLRRNLNELGRAILERRALLAMEEADTYHAIDFARLTYDALFNDYISHAIKVFEDSEVSSFWYLKRCKEQQVKDYCDKNGINLNKLADVRDKLKVIRNKTHFHIDKKIRKK